MLEIPREFNRSASPLRDSAATEESAVFLIDHVCDLLGVPDLSAGVAPEIYVVRLGRACWVGVPAA